MAFKLVRTNTTPKQFSKKVVSAMTALWFMTAVFGAVVVWRQGYGLDSLLTYVGAPMTGGIVGYLAKSAFENREKIKQSKGEEHP